MGIQPTPIGDPSGYTVQQAPNGDPIVGIRPTPIGEPIVGIQPTPIGDPVVGMQPTPKVIL